MSITNSDKEDLTQTDQKETKNNIQKQQKDQDSEVQIKEDQQSDIHELYKKLITYKTHLYKINALINIEQSEQQKEQLQTHKENLLQGITYQEEVIKHTQNNDEFQFSTEMLTIDHNNRLCRAYYEKGNKWDKAHIKEINEDTQEATISYFGQVDEIIIHAIYVKPHPLPEKNLFIPGLVCDCIYDKDGTYHPCEIEKITEEGYHIKFMKYNTQEIVPLCFLRKRKDNDITGFKRKFMSGEKIEFKIPDKYRCKPNDSEQQRLKKRKKVKQLKRMFKQKLIERDTREKKNSWNSFKHKASRKRKGYFRMHSKKQSIFKTTDTIEGKVGVTRSGEGMTNFNPRLKFIHQDNSHLSRLF